MSTINSVLSSIANGHRLGKITSWRSISVGCVVTLAALSFAAPPFSFTAFGTPAEEDPVEEFQKAEQAYSENNFRDAAVGYAKVVRSKKASTQSVISSLQQARNCLRRLRTEAEIDELLRSAVETHAESPRIIAQAATTLSQVGHYGSIVDGEFFRGNDARLRQAGPIINCVEQDRLQSLLWLQRAFELAEKPNGNVDGTTIGRWRLEFARLLMQGREGQFAWRLQSLTNLSAEPDYLDTEQQSSFSTSSAPVDSNGEVIFYDLPESFAAATSDGQRFRWLLTQASAHDETSSSALYQWAQFLDSQFSVRTLSQFAWMRRTSDSDDTKSILTLHTMDDSETTAKLAAGVKRFTLPQEFNHLAQYRKTIENGGDKRNNAANALAQIYLNRRQYSKAVELISSLPDVNFRSGLLQSIVEPRVAFDSTRPKLAGEPVELSLLFRNATEIDFTAQQVDVEALIADVKEHYRSLNSRRQGFQGEQRRRVPNLAYPQSLYSESKFDEYLQGQSIAWSQNVEPRDNHWDKRVSTTAPMTKPGLYVVNAQAKQESVANENANGNLAKTHETRILVWIQDSTIIRKKIDNGHWYAAVDAKTGTPIADGQFEFFGWKWLRNGNRAESKSFAVNLDDNGEATPELASEFQWLTVLRAPGRGTTLLNFEPFYSRNWQPEEYRQSKAYGVAERPIYRPGEKVKTKFWCSYVTYGTEEAPRVAERQLNVTVRDPSGNQIHSSKVATDEWGAFELEFDLPKTSPLGRYSFAVTYEGRPVTTRPNPSRRRSVGKPQPAVWSPGFQCNLAIRVEEYRKPEFEVNVLAPSKPVALGETVKARIQAKYFFGAPVSGAKASIKVTRTGFSQDYYPVMPFDWCYGPGYWWFAEDYAWYPGWSKWRGCSLPSFSWYPSRRSDPPELILEQDVTLDATGEAVIEIDTALAKELYGDEDHSYEISVEVQDKSRRTIVSSGNVVAAREAFQIYTWLDKGFYEVGEEVTVNFHSRMLDGTDVNSSGVLDLLRITFDENRQPIEQPVSSMRVQTADDGLGNQRLRLEKPGQYRVRLRLQDEAEHEVEGGYVFTVRGTTPLKGNEARFADLELTPDRMEYSPGDTVNLQISSDFENAEVLLFVRPSSGVYAKPERVQLEGRSAVFKIPVAEVDQPNFFVEAITVFEGELHTKVRQIVVPPEDRVLNVEVAADKEVYLPGEEAELTITATDLQGNPAEGSVLVSVFDRSLEQIAADALPSNIREFFWKWQRSHYANTSHSLQYGSYPLRIQGVQALNPLGIFGRSVADQESDDDFGDSVGLLGRGGGMGGGSRKMESLGGPPMPMAASSMMADEAMPMARSSAKSSRAPGGGGGAKPESPAVRQNFADSALWFTGVNTDANGKAIAKFKMPENLTGWKVNGWVVGAKTRVGSSSSTVVTKKPLLIRLLTPRFLVERDEVIISAVVHNDLPNAQTTTVKLEIDGETQLEMLESKQAEQVVTIGSMGQKRVDWRCKALAEGKVTVRATAVSDVASDAIQLPLPIIVYGTQTTDSWAGTLRSEDTESTIAITIPERRRIAQSQLTVRVSPTLAAAMLDSIPYLIEYPYGCTEQTLNRFLPAVLTQRSLKRLNVSLEDLAERANNLNAQQLSDAENVGQKLMTKSPVYDSARLSEVVQTGVQKLTDSQNADGGWGWFPGRSSRSTAHITAQVVRGLLVAKENGVAIVPETLQRGVSWLRNYENTQLQKLQNWDTEQKPRKQFPDNLDALVFHVLVRANSVEGLPGQTGVNEVMQNRIYQDRGKLSAYGKALLALATHQLGNAEQTRMLRSNIEQFLVTDLENETALLTDQSPWWYWYGSSNEATAMYLKLLALSDAKSETAPRLVKYLLNNRRNATYWNSTRDTALIVEAFADYLKATNEMSSDMAFEVTLGGKRIGTIEFTPETLFSANNTIQLTAAAIPSGESELKIRRTRGTGNLYWNVYSSNFTQEDDIEKAGLEVKVERRYYSLTPSKRELKLSTELGTVQDSSKSAYDRTLVEDGTQLKSGQLVEVELIIESKNDYEYLLVEDAKPAGLEAVAANSGYMWSSNLLIYRELRDRHIGLCIERLPRGRYSLTYQLRVETPGAFTALPATIEGMYSPELAGNSTDLDVKVVDLSE